MSKIVISDYLDKTEENNKLGKCKSCDKFVIWGRDRVACHKRAHCSNVTEEERILFRKRQLSPVHDTSSENSMNDSFVDFEVIENDNEKIDATIANFFFKTGISLRIADTPAFKDMINVLNPVYAQNLPSAKTVSGKLLDKQYESSSKEINKILEDSSELTLTTDGWTNPRGEHIVNFVVKAPGHKPFFIKSCNTSGVSQTAEAVADLIISVIESIGPEKFVAVITDNASNMKAAWKLIEEKYPWIAAYGCGAHGTNLLIKDIAAMPEYAKTSKDSLVVVKFIKNHHIANAIYERKRKEAKVSHKLSSPVATRFFSEYTSAKDLLDSRVMINRMVNEEEEELKAINPRATTAKALNLMKSVEFWNNLENFVKTMELPAKVIKQLEADDAPLSLIHECYSELYRHFESNPVILEKVKHRWNFVSSQRSGIAYMLNPKFAAEGFYINNDKIDILSNVKNIVNARNPELGEKAEEEMLQFVSDMSSETGQRKDILFKMDAKKFWKISGRRLYPTLHSLAKSVNEMICSSAASERVWSIFRFIHSRLRNRLTNEKIEKLVSVYINCAILDENDLTDYFTEMEMELNASDCQDDDNE